MRPTPLLFFAFGVGHATAIPVRAQQTEQVSGEVTCAECAITLDTVVTIGGLDGPGLDMVSMFSGVAIDRRGRILVWEKGEADIAVFDSTGSYLRTVGGAGEGPGEYRSISFMSVGSRYIHVFDRHRGRTMLDHDFRVVRTDRFPGEILFAAVLNDDVAVFVADVPVVGSAGYKLQVLRPSGKMTSHGDGGGVLSSGLTGWGLTMTTVAGRGDTVWAVPLESNVLVRWDLLPEPGVARVFERRVAEFDNGSDAFAPARLGPPMLDDRGLWVMWHSADPDWAGPPPSFDSLEPTPIDALRDTWIDLVDPATGRTIARYHQDNALAGFAGGSGYVVDYVETEAGVPYLHILQLRLSRR